ncbi:cell division control protein-like protein Cdc25 [Cucurbitaria berberidis CBS 394.84]|uniref:Class E vacuolar protein-sorting machinery protein HSE1 n=1 Tax=Cucurbitaria berberidis CBS 394.84 TaxID=1168544 RepID=A0A9P4GK98_9PLEO|nr:cell division control protein-like protein Cdc25 [Cucurbitaria berberidis CBS 394.84]KAF1847125.1 cell division control protein-like protein Cdc25 [Cucurbitaria berberidis CBS 394.84]
MNGFNGTVSPGGMYVKALYDYDADDRTSLSFRQGDIIQVITQLESGWWDGVINGVRGWFPSNYCTVLQRPSEDVEDDRNGGDVDDDQDTHSLGGTDYTNSDTESLSGNDTILPIERNESSKEEEAAFWIPQATPDGRLFYFNTLTGVSTMELPLESPSPNESGPRDRVNVFIPESSRPPPELLASGYSVEDTDDETSASDFEGPGTKGSYSSRVSTQGRHRLSDGLSSATSMDSMNAGFAKRSYDTGGMSFSAAALPPTGTTATSFANSPNAGAPNGTSTQSRKFYDDVNPVPLTWNRMVEDMRRAIERYREAINNSDRSEFVKRAEDISDHLRLLLAAGSGTTDNHSGNPSIISTNKALYPHFRETMSRFSKLVLSSHIAASDFPPPDSYSKCLKEADGVLNGVFGFVEVARQQRGEEIPRLVPGFVVCSNHGGSWHNNGTEARESNPSLSFIDQEDYEPSIEPTVKLDSRVLERLEDIKRLIVSSLRRLDEQLIVRDRIITHQKHQAIGEHICGAAGKVLDVCRPWISTIESINLASLATMPQAQQLHDFSIHKQKAYDIVSELVIACQGVAAPLGDEWAELRGDSLEDRINAVRAISRDLEGTVAQQYGILHALSDAVPLADIAPRADSRRNTDSELTNSHARVPSGQRPLLKDMPQSQTYSEGTQLGAAEETKIEPIRSANSNKKIKDFFGEVPVIPQATVEEIPEFLKLDHEGEISYDHKATPPQLRGGTLAGLVEQLTRHDRLDPAFNNTFLLTYRSFTTASELFEMLVKRWSIQPPHGLDKEDYQHWVDKKQKPIRFRVVNILKSWFDNYWMEGNDEEARILIQRVYNFAKDHVATTSTPGAAPLMTSVEQRSRGPDMPTKRLVPTLSAQTPQPILPKHMKKLKFLDIDATEFARQLTIIESRLYGKIRPTECLNKTWQKKLAPGEPDPAANVKALILHSNQLTNWVAQMILTQQDVKRRVIVIKHFVNVADKCRQSNNFSTLTSIISALGTAPIHRLNRTWSAVNQRSMGVLESMRKLMGSTKNFAEYRDTLHRANPPCIPFFGVYLTDLTFIEDGIPSLIKRTNLINFAKRAKTAEVIRDIQQYQNVPYPLQPVPELQDYILTNMQSAGDVHEMYEMSLSVEPREREDEKIARYTPHYFR